MTKAEVISVQKAALLSAQDAALDAFGGACFDEGALAQKASDGTLTQGDVDAAVAAAKAADAQAMLDAVAAVQVQFDAMTAKELSEEAAVAALQAKLDQIKALISG